MKQPTRNQIQFNTLLWYLFHTNYFDTHIIFYKSHLTNLSLTQFYTHFLYTLFIPIFYTQFLYQFFMYTHFYTQSYIHIFETHFFDMFTVKLLYFPILFLHLIPIMHLILIVKQRYHRADLSNKSISIYFTNFYTIFYTHFLQYTSFYI